MAHKTDYTWKDVGDIAKPDGSETTRAEKEAIAKQWNEINAPSGEKDQDLARFLRSERNALLQQSDWTQLDDVPQTTKDKYKSWRQALRDLPQHSDFPNVTIPSEPE